MAEENGRVKEARKRNGRAQDFKNVFGSQQGKRVLYFLVNEHFLMKPTLTLKNDPIEMAFNEGQRAVVLRIMSILKSKPIDLTDLLEEAHDYATSDI